ncbi:MAG TPA: DUF1697 domain-containing protein [Anaerolineae bacterium]|nr:DUF1697 domain-containing protein [Anaerolineae bacterium]
MKFVAFLRNVNLGQPKSPTREQLESAFREAGAPWAASFMSNGTLAFSASDSFHAQAVTQSACETLREVCGLREPAFVRSLEHLARLVAEDPFLPFEDAEISERSLTLFQPGLTEMVQTPLESSRKDCLVFRIDAGEAFSISRLIDGKSGYPTPVLENALHAPVTTRSWTTILRLIAKHA